MGIQIARSQFEKMQCVYQRRLSHQGDSLMGATISDEYLTGDGRTVVHTFGMGGEDFLLSRGPAPRARPVRAWVFYSVALAVFVFLLS